MMTTNRKPYEQDLTYETESFFIRRVKAADAEELLQCYSDPKSAPIFNADNCTCDFIYHDVVALTALINFWEQEYAAGYYVRYSIIDKGRNSAVGTIEMFAKETIIKDIGQVGVLRIDLASAYEKEAYLSELLKMAKDCFFEDFGVENIITKAVSIAEKRTKVLRDFGYKPLEDLDISGQHMDYYICRNYNKFLEQAK